MTGCRIEGCTRGTSSLCSGGKDIIEWICSTHRLSCSCHRCDKYRATTKRDGSLDTDYKEVVLCPHCGERCNDEYESDYISEALKGDTFDVECDSCERTFEVNSHIDVKYSTEKIDCDHENWVKVISYRAGGEIEKCRRCGIKKHELEEQDAEEHP